MFASLKARLVLLLLFFITIHYCTTYFYHSSCDVVGTLTEKTATYLCSTLYMVFMCKVFLLYVDITHHCSSPSFSRAVKWDKEADNRRALPAPVGSDNQTHS
jgi:hypothetical protein